MQLQKEMGRVLRKKEGIEKGYQSQKSVQTNDTLMGLITKSNKTSNEVKHHESRNTK
tara:strand:- start:27932 stop:28102 length:171 start_codon:yes stop_codon:yes gene_type:complete